MHRLATEVEWVETVEWGMVAAVKGLVEGEGADRGTALSTRRPQSRCV